MANVKDRTFRCDFCGKIADFDAKTKFGPWAYLCAEHFQQYGIGLGIGKGQKLHPHPIIRLDADFEIFTTPDADFHEEDLHNALIHINGYPAVVVLARQGPDETTLAKLTGTNQLNQQSKGGETT